MPCYRSPPLPSCDVRRLIRLRHAQACAQRAFAGGPVDTRQCWPSHQLRRSALRGLELLLELLAELL